jgi:hypothetical protein
MEDDWRSNLKDFCTIDHVQYDRFENGLKFLMLCHFPTRDVYFREDNEKEIKSVMRSALSINERQLLDVTDVLAIKRQRNQSVEQQDLMKERNRIMTKIRDQYNQLAVKLYGKPLQTPAKTPNKVSQPAVEECFYCEERNANVEGCEFPHRVCHICFAKIAISNKGLYKCPVCNVVSPNSIYSKCKNGVKSDNASETSSDPEYEPSPLSRTQRLERRNRDKEIEENHLELFRNPWADECDVSMSFDNESKSGEAIDVFNMTDIEASLANIPVEHKYKGRRCSNSVVKEFTPDLYRSPSSVVQLGINVLKREFPEARNILEPCSGHGDMSDVLRTYGGYNVIERDLYYLVNICLF